MVDSQFAEECLKYHNTLRSLHKSPDLIIDIKLNDFAQEWALSLADKDTLQHREENAFGENLYVGYNSDPEWELKPEVAVKSWLEDKNVKKKSIVVRFELKPEEYRKSTLISENLAPSELKKLRNKQRKQRRKAELERQQAAQAQEKREQHNKSRQQTDPDLEQPTLDELIPEKLERVEDPLEQAIKFLLPLQELAANKIETHLMAFEIYIRKGRTLLMLRSINRAHRLEPNNPELHSCLVRFLRHTSNSNLDNVIAEVVKRQSSGIFASSTASQLNAEYLKKNSNSLAHLLQGARMLYLLDPTSQQRAISLATNLEPSLEGINIENCTRVLEALSNGDFGLCEQAIADYRAKCHELFHYAAAFCPPGAKPPQQPQLINHQDAKEPQQPQQQQQPTSNKY